MSSKDIVLTTRLVISELLRQPELTEQNQEKTDFTAAFVKMLGNAAADRTLDLDAPKSAAEEFLALIKGQAFWPVVFGAPVVSEREMKSIFAQT